MGRNRRRGVLLAIVCVAAGCISWAQTGPQNQTNPTTEVIFTAPTEIPGRVLQPGKYLFTLLPGDPDHNMVQVWSTNREHLLATILTVPDYRLHAPTGSSTLKFDVNRYGEVDALRAWFFPGDNYGHEFVYPEDRAKVIASRSGRPVLAMSNRLAANITNPEQSGEEATVVALEKAQVNAITPNGQAVDKSQAFGSMSESAPPVTAKPQ